MNFETLLTELKSSVEDSSPVSLNVAGLRLTIESSFRPYINAVATYMAPLDLTWPDDEIRTWHLVVTNQIWFSKKLFQLIEEAAISPTKIKHRRQDLYRISVNSDVDICYHKLIGTCWIVDRKRHQVTLVLSARTSEPGYEVFKTARNIIVAHLQNQGWSLFHAGAVEFKDNCRLIVGNGGAGKSSLIALYLNSGGHFISNERSLLKVEAAGVRVIPFPMPIAVGLGTLLQYPGLEKYIHSPENLRLPRLRFDQSRVATTPISQWPTLPDKLQFTPVELAQALGSPQAKGQGMVQEIIVPRIRFDNVEESSLQSDDFAHNVLAENYLTQPREKHYPNWMPLGFSHADSTQDGSIISRLLKIPIRQLNFLNPTSTIGKHL